MHELSIAQSLVEQIARILEAETADRVTRVDVAIGAFSGVEPDALELAFPVAAEDTPVAGARLVMTQVPATVRCRACGLTSTPAFPVMVCGHCASTDVELTGGHELLLSSMELATDDASGAT